MRLDFFKNLPPEIIIDIISRLPAQTILSCKCVCKSWLDLIESPEFSELQFSKSALGLVVCLGQGRPKPYRILEVLDDLDMKNSLHYYNVLVSLDLNFGYRADLHSSVNGLLFMYDRQLCMPRHLYICNPITRDYIDLPPPLESEFSIDHTFGFGVSKMTGQYKLVMVFRLESDQLECGAYTDCAIYTLGTGSWRITVADYPLRYRSDAGVYLNGNLHWLAWDSLSHELLSCFDLETELFSTFSLPSNRQNDGGFNCFSTLGDCLCVCDNVEGEIVVWLMKQYGDEKSWTKEYVIEKPSGSGFLGFNFLPVKVYRDGDILIVDKDFHRVICYSNDDGTIEESDPFGRTRIGTIFYTPSFLSVKMFAAENVSSF